MEKDILAWVKLYQTKCRENKELRAEVAILQRILHSYLVVIDGKDNTNK
jgi:hypothetical protein